jgi:hypothetical protein
VLFDRPLAQGFCGQAVLADVPLWRKKSTNQQPSNFTGNRALSQVQELGLWINKAFICNVLCGAMEG